MRAPLLFLFCIAGCGAAGAQTADEAGLRGSLTVNAHAVASGGQSREGTALEQLQLGWSGEVAPGWRANVSVVQASGSSLSARAIGDVQGVQGAFTGGDAVYLQDLNLTREFANGNVTLGRLSSGGAFGTVGTMDQLVNSAFSSNGGWISVNTPGRLPEPFASWGATGEYRPAETITARGGVFLSDPERASPDRPRDLSLQPGDGVLGFAEAAYRPSDGVELGAGAWADSARFDTFAGAVERGSWGAYVWTAGRLLGPAEGRRLEGFAMLQAAPRRDRSLVPWGAVAGVTLFEPVEGRAADTLTVGVASGRFNSRSGLSGTETTVEAAYGFAVNDRLTLRPDVQYVFNPGGRFRDALVVGVQVEAGF